MHHPLLSAETVTDWNSDCATSSLATWWATRSIYQPSQTPHQKAPVLPELTKEIPIDWEIKLKGDTDEIQATRTENKIKQIILDGFRARLITNHVQRCLPYRTLCITIPHSREEQIIGEIEKLQDVAQVYKSPSLYYPEFPPCGICESCKAGGHCEHPKYFLGGAHTSSEV